MPTETGEMRSKSGGMSVSLMSPDEQVVGGGVADLLVVASPVQIVVGSFLARNQHEQKSKKQKIEFATTATSTVAISISGAEMEETYGGTPTSTTQKTNFSSSFRGDNWSSLPPESRNKPTTINVTVLE